MAEATGRKPGKQGARNREWQIFALRLVLLLGPIAAVLLFAGGLIVRKDPLPAFALAAAMAVVTTVAAIQLVAVRRR